MFPCRHSVVEISINLSRYSLQQFSLFVISHGIYVDVNDQVVESYINF